MVAELPALTETPGSGAGSWADARGLVTARRSTLPDNLSLPFTPTFATCATARRSRSLDRKGSTKLATVWLIASVSVTPVLSGNREQVTTSTWLDGVAPNSSMPEPAETAAEAVACTPNVT